MISDFLIYLLEVSFATGLVAGLYKLVFARLTFFNWNRWYILGGLAVGLVVPLLPLTFFTGWSGLYQQQDLDTFLFSKQLTIGSPETGAGIKQLTANEYSHLSLLEITTWIFLMIYAIGVLYKSYTLIKGLGFVFNLRRSAKQIEAVGSHIIYIQQVLPSFSFGRNIFLHSATETLSREEVELIISHERAHIKLGHTWDVMFIEITRVIFWFNPFLTYMSASLKAIHEYQADAHVAGVETVSYGKLIIKLASAGSSFSLRHTFSDSQIFNRIEMLTKPKSSSMQKLRFLWSLPARVHFKTSLLRGFL